MSIYAQVRVADVTVVALDRMGGHSVAPFDSLNLADYVGDSLESVAENIHQVLQYLGADDIAVMNAEHGNHATVVSVGGKCAPADVLVTQVPGLALLALAADCVPVALVDSTADVVAVVHVGWKGLMANVVRSALSAFQDSGANLSQTVAVIGPSICGTCYEVSLELAQLISAAHPASAVDERHIDLAVGVSAALEQQGVQVQRIDGCTYESQDLFSYRRAQGQPTGRGGLAVMLPPTGRTSGAGSYGDVTSGGVSYG